MDLIFTGYFLINGTILASVKLNMKLVAFRLGGKADATPLSLLTEACMRGWRPKISVFAVPRRSPYNAGIIPTLVRLILLSKLFCYLGEGSHAFILAISMPR